MLTALRGSIRMLTALRGSIRMLTALRGSIRRRWSLSLRLRRGGRDRRTLPHCTKGYGRGGPAVMWFAALDRLTALHDLGGGPLRLRLRRGGRDRRTNLHCTR